MQAHDKRLESVMQRLKLRSLFSAAVAVPALLLAVPVMAEDESSEGEDVEKIVVTGTRGTIQTSISEKRESDLMVDALSSEELGDIPALSIGEALETLTGAASHREQGGATEISIRGMGPFLGSTTINGREATNGSGDRSVNFSQFPSELFNSLKIYKTQQAKLIEGGVSGQIALESIKPIDYGKQRFQADLKGNYNPDNQNIENNNNDIGYRSTFSYIDQIDTTAGEFGFSIGMQRNETSNPEQEYRTSSEYRDCRLDPSKDSGVYASGNCDGGDGDLKLERDLDTGLVEDEGVPFILVPSSRTYRQNITDDQRDAIFTALQWRTEDWDINFDYQYSDRVFSEIRNDLVFAENRRVDPDALVSNEKGEVFSYTNDGRIETHSQFQERLEKYYGGGFNVQYQASEDLKISFDYSYSNTERQENIYQTRLQSEPTDIFGNDTPAGTDRPDAFYDLYPDGSDVPLVTVTNFDVTNPDLFADSARTRIDLNQYRVHEVQAYRTDFELATDMGAIYSIESGLRYSNMEFDNVPRARDERTFSDDSIEAASLKCRNDVFPESGFLSEPSNGKNLITNVDADGNVIASGTGSTFATFDPMCLVSEFVGGIPVIPEAGLTSNNSDVEEETLAAYVQFNYDAEMLGSNVRGNFGVRVVRTEVTSLGLRAVFESVPTDEGGIQIIEQEGTFTMLEGGSSYTEVLPSFNMVMDLDDDLLLRLGIFRGLSRPDPNDIGFGRGFDLDDDTEGDVDTFLETFFASGSPNLEPLTSWNFDVSMEWYPDEDSILAVGLYYKRFLGGFETTQVTETFVVDGQSYDIPIDVQRTDDEESSLYGLELTAAHSFSYLDGWLSGFGAKLSYNYADSEFETEHSLFGSAVVLDEFGNVITDRVGIVEPANIFGLSEHVLSAQLYYQYGDFDVQLINKRRSDYFQQFISTPGFIRYIGDVDVYEARITYKMSDNVQFRVEGINLFDEPKTQFNPTPDNLAEINSYGPRYFAGVKVTF